LRRRELIRLLGGVASLPLAARAEQVLAGSKIPRIGVLWHAGSEDEEREYFTILMQAFGDLGYVDGKTAEFIHRYPAERSEQFNVLAQELVDARPDVIVAVTIRGATALKRITQSVPVVFVLAADAVGDGLVETLAHPGGNMTGLSLMLNDLSGKRLGLLREAVPGMKRAAFIIDPNDPNSFRLEVGRKTAESFGIVVGDFPVGDPSGIEAAFAAAAAGGYDGALAGGSMFFNERKRVGAAALANKMPTITAIAEMVPYGVLMSYGPDFPDFFRRSVRLAVRVLKGEAPANLPVEQPTRFRQVVNLKVANALGLTIPDSLAVAADEMIE
jgi:putative tryptophan/tyrosine transport system substrate-binding protein